ncbi:MAG: carbonic anhydrase [Planctomycetota bacterium]|jgi:carbonic anhydrase
MPDSQFSLRAFRANIGHDLVAGLVVFLVALPLCLGIAHASGAPLQAGLISGIIGGLVIGWLSGSHTSVSGPAAGLAAIVITQIQSLGSFEAFLMAVMLSGFLQIVFGALRFGGLGDYFPNSVVKGLLAAIGVLLILKQLPHLLGHDEDYEGDMSFAQADGENTFSSLQRAMMQVVPGATMVGLVSLAILIFWGRTRLKKLLLPGALCAVVIGTVINELMVMTGSAWAITESHLVTVPVVLAKTMGWADLLHLPDFSRCFDPAVLQAAMTLAIVASLESLLNLEATDKIDPLRRSSPPNRELYAQGLGNMLAGAVGGLPLTTSIARSSININAGNRSCWSTIIHGLLLLVCVGTLGALINRIPLAALAAVLVVTGFQLASPKLFREMWRDGWNQFLPFVVTIVAIVTTDLLTGVLIGLGVGLTFVLLRNLNGGFQVVREDHAAGVVHRIELSNHASFINRAQLAKQLDSYKRGSHIVLDARRTDYVDPEVQVLIREFVNETAPARKVEVSTIGFKDHYAVDNAIHYIDYTTRELQASMTPQRVLQVLKDGNERFATDKRLMRDLVRQVDQTSEGQHPMAVVLSCIDSRAPAEILFDLGIGDIFSVRVAGNVAREKVLGSMEFACKIAGSKLILVLGHTRCGAVKASCDFEAQGVSAQEATDLSNLGSITKVIGEAVHQETETTDDRTSKNEGFVTRVATLHVQNTIAWIRGNSPTLKAMLDSGEIGIAGGLYDITAGRVTFFEVQCGPLATSTTA